MACPCPHRVHRNAYCTQEAIDFYTSLFDASEVNEIARYGPNQEPDGEGLVMFADFILEQQRFAAMDSAGEHDYGFNEAISFIVDCRDKEEIDYFWERLTADGGMEGQSLVVHSLDSGGSKRLV